MGAASLAACGIGGRSPNPPLQLLTADPCDALTESTDCSADGCLLDTTDFGAYSREQIESYLDAGVSIDNGYHIYSVRYRTDGRQARATITIPHDVEPPDGGWHVAINNPGTVGVADACTLGYSVAGVGLAGLFGARGLIGVAIDYPGLGTPGLHPYLVKEVEGRASLDGARAALRLACSERVPVSGRVAISGLSQGGHATLAAASAHAAYAPELDVRAFAAVAPASVFLEHWAQSVDIPGPHLVYHALLTYAWSDFYGHLGSSLWAAAVRDQIDDVMTSRCTYAADGPTLRDELGDDPQAIFTTEFLDAFARQDFAAYPAFSQGFAANRIDPYEQTAPLRIYQGTSDSSVLPSHTEELVESLRSGGVEVDYLLVNGGNHTNVAFGFLANEELRTAESIAWLKEQLAAER